MRFPKHISRRPVLFVCFLACGAGWLRAQEPTTWWPDPSTGLMWTGTVSTIPYGRGRNWQQATEYCASLQLGGYSGWKLPSLDEVEAITFSQHIIPVDHRVAPYDSPTLKGNINGPHRGTTWTMTLSGNNEAWMESFWNGHRMSLAAPVNSALLAEPLSTLCTRVMESQLRQVAEDAQVNQPVHDVLTLKAWVPLTKANLAYQRGQFQDAIKQAESSLAIKPDFATADWAIGISYGRLGQWDLAVANLKAALKIDKNNDDFKSAVKWANEGQRAAKSGKAPKAPPPLWN
jgi:hypothetical protein